MLQNTDVKHPPPPATPNAVAAAPPQLGVPATTLTFIIVTFLMFLLGPCFVLVYVFFQSDYFQDLPNSGLYRPAFNFFVSPSEVVLNLQKLFLPAISASIPLIYAKKRGTSILPFEITLIVGVSLMGFFTAALVGLVLDMPEHKERLFVENALGLDPKIAENQNAFDAKLTVALGYLSRLQESLLFIIASVVGVKAVLK